MVSIVQAVWYRNRVNILVSGSTGLVGSALVARLERDGHRVTRLVRSGQTGVRWDPAAGKIDEAGLEGLDAVVHLAGENVAARRWTDTQKSKIRGSRVNGTRTLCEALARLKNPPKTLLSASAVGIYGDRGDEILRDESKPGTGFLADVCRDWETATRAAAQKGIRVANLRIGIVLSLDGGALARMIPPFKMGLGGRLGSGKQYMSWITLDDTVHAIVHALNTPALSGPVNLVSPNAVTNLEFTKTLARALSRPAFFPMPAFAARLAFGELADALLLAGARATPTRLDSSGFAFQYPILENAIRHLLGRSARL